nr:multi antimicrobial extrusion protein [Tanacetum cinerariifolium]
MENGKQHLQPLLTVESGVKINGVRGFCKEFYMESKKLWYIAGPAIFTSLCQYTIGATTQLFAGQLGTIHLAAVSVENSVIAGIIGKVVTTCGGLGFDLSVEVFLSEAKKKYGLSSK